MSRKVRYEEMLPHEVVAARTETPLAYLPIGGIEWHGEHNCLGLDTVKIHALALRCAQAGGGLVFPGTRHPNPDMPDMQRKRTKQGWPGAAQLHDNLQHLPWKHRSFA